MCSSCNKLDLNGQVFEQNEKGEWIYKAEDSKFKTQKGTLKAQYKDLPRYKLIYNYEDHFRAQFDNTLRQIQKDIKKKMEMFVG